MNQPIKKLRPKPKTRKFYDKRTICLLFAKLCYPFTIIDRIQDTRDFI